MFLEMPNCLMDETFKRRPYDSPHLTFWNTSAMSQLAQAFYLELINLCSSGISLTVDYEAMKNWRVKYNSWRPRHEVDKFTNLLYKFRFFHSYTFLYFKKIIRRWLSILGLQPKTSDLFLDLNPYNPNSDYWCIRATYKFLP